MRQVIRRFSRLFMGIGAYFAWEVAGRKGVGVFLGGMAVGLLYMWQDLRPGWWES